MCWLQTTLKVSILHLCCIVALARDPRVLSRSTTCRFDAIYQFGDSLSDTGNGMMENPATLCTSFPYGETYFQYATGRCSDGLIMADYYATAFGLPFLNPFLKRDSNFSNGVDFSVAGASALDASFLESKNITVGTTTSLSVQLSWFRDHLKSVCSSASECKSKLGRSLFFMEAIGGNDYNYAYDEDKSLQFAYDLVPDVIQAVMDGIKQLLQFGAVHVVVPGVVPFGCVPSYLAQFKSTDPTVYDELGCVKGFNELAEFHNRHLQNATKVLQMLYPSATLIFADYYHAIRRVLQNAASYGFEEDAILVACCGGGKNPYNFDWSEFCGKQGVPVCPDPSKRINWDGLHYTQKMYEYVSEWMLKHTIMPKLSHASSL